MFRKTPRVRRPGGAVREDKFLDLVAIERDRDSRFRELHSLDLPVGRLVDRRCTAASEAIIEVITHDVISSAIEADDFVFPYRGFESQSQTFQPAAERINI